MFTLSSYGWMGNGWMGAATAWLFNYLVHSTLLLGGAWLASRWLAGRHTAAEEWLWRSALLGGLVTASLQLAFGGAVANAPVPSSEPRPAIELAIVAPQSVVFTGTALDVSAAPDESPVTAVPIAAQAGSLPWSLPSILLALWVSGAAFFGVRLTARWVAFRRRLAGRRSILGGPLAEMLVDLTPPAFAGRAVRLTATRRFPVPFARGTARPEICMPERAVRSLEPTLQQGILAHEVAHLVRRDPLWLAALRLAEALFFFQPLHRVASRRLAELSEYHCDDWAARATGRGKELARCLTEVAAWLVDRPASLPAPAMARSRSSLALRIERLLAGSAAGAERRVPRWALPLAAMVLAGMVAFAPGLTLAGGSSDEPESYDTESYAAEPEETIEPEAPEAPELAEVPELGEAPWPIEAPELAEAQWPAEPSELAEGEWLAEPELPLDVELAPLDELTPLAELAPLAEWPIEPFELPGYPEELADGDLPGTPEAWDGELPPGAGPWPTDARAPRGAIPGAPVPRGHGPMPAPHAHGMLSPWAGPTPHAAPSLNAPIPGTWGTPRAGEMPTPQPWPAPRSMSSDSWAPPAPEAAPEAPPAPRAPRTPPPPGVPRMAAPAPPPAEAPPAPPTPRTPRAPHPWDPANELSGIAAQMEAMAEDGDVPAEDLARLLRHAARVAWRAGAISKAEQDRLAEASARRADEASRSPGKVAEMAAETRAIAESLASRGYEYRYSTPRPPRPRHAPPHEEWQQGPHGQERRAMMDQARQEALRSVEGQREAIEQAMADAPRKALADARQQIEREQAQLAEHLRDVARELESNQRQVEREVRKHLEQELQRHGEISEEEIEREVARAKASMDRAMVETRVQIERELEQARREVMRAERRMEMLEREQVRPPRPRTEATPKPEEASPEMEVEEPIEPPG